MCLIKPKNEETYKIDGCFVDEKERFAFIHIYKNASISLRNALGMRGRYYKWNDVKDNGLKTITIIRNPIDRVISMYLYLLRLEDNDRPDQHPIHLTENTCFYKERENVIQSFYKFLIAIEGGNYYDAVTCPQIGFLNDRNLTINDIDEVFVQENMAVEFPKFVMKYKLEDVNPIFPIDNRGNDEKKKIITEYLNTHFFTKLDIMEAYASDIDMYNRIVNKRNKNLII